MEEKGPGQTPRARLLQETVFVPLGLEVGLDIMFGADQPRFECGDKRVGADLHQVGTACTFLAD